MNRSVADARDRVDRNADGSLDDILLCLEPDLMLRAEEMDDGILVGRHSLHEQERRGQVRRRQPLPPW